MQNSTLLITALAFAMALSAVAVGSSPAALVEEDAFEQIANELMQSGDEDSEQGDVTRICGDCTLHSYDPGIKNPGKYPSRAPPAPRGVQPFGYLARSTQARRHEQNSKQAVIGQARKAIEDVKERKLATAQSQDQIKQTQDAAKENNSKTEEAARRKISYAAKLAAEKQSKSSEVNIKVLKKKKQIDEKEITKLKVVDGQKTVQETNEKKKVQEAQVDEQLKEKEVVEKNSQRLANSANQLRTSNTQMTNKVKELSLKNAKLSKAATDAATAEIAAKKKVTQLTAVKPATAPATAAPAPAPTEASSAPTKEEQNAEAAERTQKSQIETVKKDGLQKIAGLTNNVKQIKRLEDQV